MVEYALRGWRLGIRIADGCEGGERHYRRNGCSKHIPHGLHPARQKETLFTAAQCAEAIVCRFRSGWQRGEARCATCAA